MWNFVVSNWRGAAPRELQGSRLECGTGGMTGRPEDRPTGHPADRPPGRPAARRTGGPRRTGRWEQLALGAPAQEARKWSFRSVSSRTPQIATQFQAIRRKRWDSVKFGHFWQGNFLPGKWPFLRDSHSDPETHRKSRYQMAILSESVKFGDFREA